MLLTQREKEIEGLDITEGGDVEDVNHQFHNPEPSEIEKIQIRQTLSRKQVDPPSVEPTVDHSVDTTSVRNQRNVEFYNVTVAGYDKQVVDLEMLDWRHSPEAGRDSLSPREPESILSGGAPSDRNTGHEDHLKEPPVGKATIEDAKVGCKQLKSMLDDPQTMKYNTLQDSDEGHLRVFTDSSWGKLNNIETVNGNLVFLVDSQVSSPLAGEAVAALDGYNKIPWIRSLAEDLGFGKLPATMMVDSRSLCDAVEEG